MSQQVSIQMPEDDDGQWINRICPACGGFGKTLTVIPGWNTVWCTAYLCERGDRWTVEHGEPVGGLDVPTVTV